MDTQNQFAIFGICLCIGFVGGVLYEIFAPLRLAFGCAHGKNKIVGYTLDVVFWICFAVFTVFAAYLFHFPAFRVYMWIGYVLGGILYLKTLRRIVAFLENMCYNKITKLVKKAKSQRKKSSEKVEREI